MRACHGFASIMVGKPPKCSALLLDLVVIGHQAKAVFERLEIIVPANVVAGPPSEPADAVVDRVRNGGLEPSR